MAQAYKIKAIPHTTTPEKFGITFEEVWYKTIKNLNLYGWWIPVTSDNQKPVLILVHGWQRNVERMLPYIIELHSDYNILVFDARNHGISDEDSLISMPKFTEDILASLDFLETKSNIDSTKIGIIGLSMGGAAAIYAAAQDKRINSIITIGAFANPKDIMEFEFKKRRIPYFPFVYFFLKYVEYKIGVPFNTFAPVNNIGKTNARITLVHGSEDVTAPYQQAELLYAASIKENTQLWKIEGASHSNCHKFPGYWDHLKLVLENAQQ